MTSFRDLMQFLEDRCNFRKESGKLTWTCDGTLRFTKKFCETNRLDHSRAETLLQDTGGWCDCEVLLNSHERIADSFTLPKETQKK